MASNCSTPLPLQHNPDDHSLEANHKHQIPDEVAHGGTIPSNPPRQNKPPDVHGCQGNENGCHDDASAEPGIDDRVQ